MTQRCTVQARAPVVALSLFSLRFRLSSASPPPLLRCSSHHPSAPTLMHHPLSLPPSFRPSIPPSLIPSFPPTRARSLRQRQWPQKFTLVTPPSLPPTNPHCLPCHPSPAPADPQPLTHEGPGPDQASEQQASTQGTDDGQRRSYYKTHALSPEPQALKA